MNVTGSVCPSGATLSVSPSGTSVGAGQTLQLTATVTGVTGPVVSWTISPLTFGSIVSTGPTTSTYTAPTSPTGVVQILAALSSCTSGPAVIDTVTISSAPPPQQAAPPAFSPAPGSYSGVKNVFLSSTPGATIYYTLDGTPATTSSTVYSGPIPLSANQTINAIAGGTGFNSSVMVSGRYSFFAQSGAIIPGTLSAFIPTTPVGTVPSDVVFDAAGNFYVLDSGLGTITKFAAGTSTGGTVIVPTGTLSNPQFFTVGVDGQTLFVSDYGNNRIVTVSQATSPATVTPLTTNIPPPSTPCAAFPTATLCQPTGIFVDSRANLLVADSGNHRVLQLTSTGTYVKTLLDKTIYAGTLQTFFGIAEDNAGNVFVANAPAASSMVGGSLLLLTPSGTAGTAPIVSFKPQSPYGVTADPSGNIYVSDQYAKKIYEYLAGTYSSYIVAGGQGTNGPTTADSGDGGPATIGTLAGPLGIALDSNYNVYVADANAQASSGGSIQQVNVSQGVVNFPSTNDGQPALVNGYFINPSGASLTIGLLGFTGTNAADFSIQTTTPIVLPAGRVQLLSLTFTPSAVGPETATLTPTELFGGNPSPVPQFISLGGTGTAAPPPYLPTITSIGPTNALLGLAGAGGYPGQSNETITITGTNFLDPTGKGALPVFNFGNGITVTPVGTVQNTSGSTAQSMQVSITIDPNTPVGTSYVSVTTGSPTTFKGGSYTQQTSARRIHHRSVFANHHFRWPSEHLAGITERGRLPWANRKTNDYRH